MLLIGSQRSAIASSSARSSLRVILSAAALVTSTPEAADAMGGRSHPRRPAPDQAPRGGDAARYRGAFGQSDKRRSGPVEGDQASSSLLRGARLRTGPYCRRTPDGRKNPRSLRQQPVAARPPRTRAPPSPV